MKIAIGFDHAAVESKAWLEPLLAELGHTVLDLGCYSTESCDYPDYAGKVARAVADHDVDRGILVCGTGIGMSMAANRYTGVRAALCTSTELAQLSREHNDANILCMGARTQSQSDMTEIVQVWLSTEWEGGRHGRRLAKMDALAKE